MLFLRRKNRNRRREPADRAQDAKMFNVLADEKRLLILDYLIEHQEGRVSDLARQMGVSVANTSHHLQILKRGGIVQSEKVGVSVIYTMTESELAQKTVRVMNAT